MKNTFKAALTVLVFCLLAVSPVAAHCGHCDMDKAAEGGASAKHCALDGARKECSPNCDKPCCAGMKDKTCSMNDKKKTCDKAKCADKKSRGNAKMNFVPGNRR